MYLLEDPHSWRRAGAPVSSRSERLRGEAAAIYERLSEDRVQLDSSPLPVNLGAPPNRDLSPEESFKLGRASLESLEGSKHFDYYSIHSLPAIGVSKLSSPSFTGGGERGLHDLEGYWKFIDREIEALHGRGKLSFPVTILGFEKIPKKIHGTMVLDEDATEAGYHLHFSPSKLPRGEKNQKFLRRFQYTLEGQHHRSSLAKSYLDLPDAEPMSRECFLRLYEALSLLCPTLNDPEGAKGLHGFLGGRAPLAMTLDLGKRHSDGDATFGDSRGLKSSLTLTVHRCEQCGLPQRVSSATLRRNAKLSAGLSGDSRVDAVSSVLEETHRKEGCGIAEATNGPML